MTKIFHDLEKCTHCGICVHACPLELFVMNRGRVNVNPEKQSLCINCKLCYNACPQNAILVETENDAKKIMM